MGEGSHWSRPVRSERRMSRMRQLIEIAKTRPLTDAEKAELQARFLRLAHQDLRVMRDEGLIESGRRI
jgi:predicted transcriptional regulator